MLCCALLAALHHALVLLAAAHTIERIVLLVYPFGPAVLTTAKHKDSGCTRARELVIVLKRDDTARIAKDMPAQFSHGSVFRYIVSKIYLRPCQNRKSARILVVSTYTPDAVFASMKQRARFWTSINTVEVIA